MSFKDHTRKIPGFLLEVIKTAAITLLLVGFLQITGLLQSLSEWSQQALLLTGLRNAPALAEEKKEAFDYQFTIQDMQGSRQSFEQFKGKVVFLNLWATWCGPCRAEMPGIQRLYEMTDHAKVTFVMLSLDKDTDKKKVADYVKNKGFTFNAYMPSGYLPEQLQVPSIPTTFILTPDGTIARKEVGTMRYDTPKFKEFLEGLAK